MKVVNSQTISRIVKRIVDKSAPIALLSVLLVNAQAVNAAKTIPAIEVVEQPARFLDKEKHLPLPAELQKDVQFWINVFSKADTNSGYLHDSELLHIVYGKIKFEENASRRQRDRLVKQHKKKIGRILKRLAHGKKKLNKEEQRIRDLWPENVESKALLEAVDRLRFQLGQSDKFKSGIERSGRWMQHFSAMMAKHDVPDLLRLLPHVESSFVPFARSNVGAAGMWQFTRGTGRIYMKVNHVIDERLDPYIAAEAAAKLLKNNYDNVQSWPLAITAYNHGLRSAQRAAAKYGKDELFTILREYDGKRFGFASRNFYLSFAAAVHVHLNYQKYFGDLEIEAYQKPDIIKLPNYLSVKALKSLPIDIKEFKRLNPALSDAVWRGDKYIPKNYALRLPEGSIATISAFEKQHWHLAQVPDLYHRVRRGETLSQIAQRYKVSLRKLKRANNIRNARRIQIGQKLVLPGRLAKRVKHTQVAKTKITREQKGNSYLVQKGDTLSEIAKSFKLPQDDLMQWNKIKNVRQLRVGQALTLQSPSALSKNKQESVSKLDSAKLKPVKAPTSNKFKASTSLAESMALDAKGRAVVLPRETIGHYADWLGLKTQSLRRLNNLSYKQSIVTGKKINLQFDQVSKDEFMQKRLRYHEGIRERFYTKYKVMGQTEYKIKNGDSLWLLAQRDYRVPIWLLKEYNPGIEIEKIYPGAKVVFPLIVERKNT